jgi:3-hydroxyacyl-CoA dehydrogenase/enoyl-CoA hydratase/3-hydroxybutyryl-CoA epimerase
MSKAFNLEKKSNGITILWFDLPGEKVNKFNAVVMEELSEITESLKKEKEIKALLLMSKKEGIFIAGADVNEIKDIRDENIGYEVARKGQDIFKAFGDLPFKTISVINGACMGGGTELSIACDFRLATDHSKTKIALPEVNIGILPGWGGTSRLPELIGLQRAMDVILTGRSYNPKKAWEIGLIDKILPAEWVEEKAIEFAKEILEKGGLKYEKRRKPSDPASLVLEKTPFGRNIMFSQAEKMIMKKTKGHYPAPLLALETIQKTYGKPLKKAFEIEAKALGKLIVTDICKNLVQIFFWTEEIKKENGVSNKDLKGNAVHKTAILGAGVMGGGIAQLFASKGIMTRIKDIHYEAVAKAYSQVAEVLKSKLKRRRINKMEFTQIMNRISGTTDYSGFKTVDFVVEAIVEDLKIKKKTLKELEKEVGKDTIIATNTSSLLVDDMAKALGRKSKFLGMHFFNPVHKMPLVEVIKGEKTSDEAIATVFNLSKRAGKTPIVVKDGPGFLVNRLLVPYMVEAISLLMEAHTIENIDKAMTRFGMPMGPIELFDEVGLDVANKVAKILAGFMGDRMAESPILDNMVEAGRLGKKNGKGFYKYAGKKRLDDPAVEEFIDVAHQTILDEEQMQKRMVYPMINEAARCLEEGIVERPRDVDIGMIFGTGFAPFKGGLLKYADSEGLKSVIEMLKKFETEYGERFKPAEALQKIATTNGTFY